MPTDAQIRTALDTLGTHQLAAHECFGGAAAVLRDGEVICEKEPCVYYMQAFADREEEIIIRLDDVRECVPGVVTQYMPIPKED